MCGLHWKYIFMLIVLVYQVSGYGPDVNFLSKSGDAEHDGSRAGDLVYQVSAYDPDDEFLPKSSDAEHDGSRAGDVDSREHYPEKLVARSGLEGTSDESRLAGPGKLSFGFHRERQFRCYFSPSKGECAAKYIRFHYNYLTNTCMMFLWSGCGGNGNRFLTRTECMRTCNP